MAGIMITVHLSLTQVGSTNITVVGRLTSQTRLVSIWYENIFQPNYDKYFGGQSRDLGEIRWNGNIKNANKK